MDINCSLLSLRKANECCAIKGLRKTSVWKEKRNWESGQVRVSAGTVELNAGLTEGVGYEITAGLKCQSLGEIIATFETSK